MKHNLRRPAGHENLDGWMVARPIWQGIYQARRLPVNPAPVIYAWAGQAGGMGNGRYVEQQVGGPAKGGMDKHRVLDGLCG
jgi:hypothetical protein